MPSGLMHKVRHCEDRNIGRDMDVLEKLWKKTGAGELVLPVSAVTPCNLVLEGEGGQVESGLLGGMVWSFVPLIDPGTPFTEQEWEKFKSLIAGAENVVRSDDESAMLFWVPQVYEQLVQRFDKFAVRLNRQFVPFCHFLKPEAQKGKQQ